MKKFPLKTSSLQDLYLYLLFYAQAPVPGADILRALAGSEDWSTAILGRMPQKLWPESDMQRVVHTPGCLRTLYGMAFGRWDADTLWVLPRSKEAGRRLRQHARAWHAAVSLGGPSEELPDASPSDPENLLWFRWETPPMPDVPLPTEPTALTLHGETGKYLQDLTPAGVMLELLRRTRFNAFDGRRIARDLVANAPLWRGFFLGISDSILETGERRNHEPTRFHTLRFLDDEQEGHHGDQLWVLCPDLEAARTLLKLGKRRWQPDGSRLWNTSNTRRVTGCARGPRVVSFWWD